MMNQRELETRIKALHKAQAANEPPANIIALMELLKKEDVPTEEMLRVSRIAFLSLPCFSPLSDALEPCVNPRHDDFVWIRKANAP